MKFSDLGTRFATISVLAAAGCSGGNGSGPANVPSGTATPPPVITETYTFPPGTANASEGTAWNITGLKTTLSGLYGDANGNSYDTLRVDVTFAQDISSALPAPGQQLLTGTQLGVQVFIDADGNPATGSNPSCNTNVKQSPFEFVTDQGNDPSRLPDGNYSLLGVGGGQTSENAGPAGEAVTSVSGHVLSESFFLTALGIFDGTKVPRIGIAAAAFNGASQFGVDCVPTGNSAEVFSS